MTMADDGELGAKLLADIQAEGLRAAGSLVERLVQFVDGARAAADETSDDAVQTGPASIDMGAVLPWFDLWRDLLGRTSDTMDRLRVAGPDSRGLPVDGSLAPTRPLAIAVDRDGSGLGEMWLHNGTDADCTTLVPRCGPLSDVDGTALKAAVDIDPPKIDALPSHSSRGFAISVTVDQETTPGTYRGIMQVSGAPLVWMPIEVVVAARSS